MHKLFILLAVCFLTACNNSNNPQSANGVSASQTTTNGISKDPVARRAKFTFIDDCMQNARITLGDQKAYAYCKCIYEQLKAQNPGADSVEIEELALDTARIVRMAEKCR